MKKVESVRATSDQAQFVSDLFERDRSMLLRYLIGLLERHDDAEDALQETYVRLLKTDNLEWDVSRARAYAFRIATNLAYDSFKRRKRVIVEDSRSEEDLVDAENLPELIIGLEQSLSIVRTTVLGLKPRCRQVFLLRVSEGWSYEAIADKLDISKRTVEREMKRALDACQKRLERSRT